MRRNCANIALYPLFRCTVYIPTIIILQILWSSLSYFSWVAHQFFHIFIDILCTFYVFLNRLYLGCLFHAIVQQPFRTSCRALHLNVLPLGHIIDPLHLRQNQRTLLKLALPSYTLCFSLSIPRLWDNLSYKGFRCPDFILALLSPTFRSDGNLTSSFFFVVANSAEFLS